MPPTERIPHLRNLSRTDLYFLLTVAIGREDIKRQWLFERCKEVQLNPDGYLDLWSREHYKSTIITFGKTIQDILASHGEDPLPEWEQEVTVGIFSHTKPIAKGFLKQIKRELEDNALLKEWFPDILWDNPKRESPGWSEDAGLIVKRKGNPKEATVEAHGLVDGQPTSKHFVILNYDDVVTRESVTSPEMILKTTDAWALSLNLGADGGVRRTIGTRYHLNDTYKVMMERGAAIQRIHPATDNGKADGNPVLLTKETLAEKRKHMGPFVYGCQMLQDPVADAAQGFSEEWLKFWKADNYDNLNIYIIVDPANEKKKENDYTSMVAVGLGADKNYYVIDLVRDRFNLTERTDKLFEWHRKYQPIDVGYEQYGMQSDIQHIEYVQDEKNYRFDITKLAGATPKKDRIRRLIPVFEQGKIYLPRRLTYIDYEGSVVDLVSIFMDSEYIPFPVMSHDDMLDNLARIKHPDWTLEFPIKTMMNRASIQGSIVADTDIGY